MIDTVILIFSCLVAGFGLGSIYCGGRRTGGRYANTSTNSTMDTILALRDLVHAVESIPGVGEAVDMEVRCQIIRAKNVLKLHQ
jgi:hypothetical protein